jgi:hypothetical protein
MAWSPDSSRIAVLLCGFREQGLQIVDPARGRVTQTVLQPAAFLGLAFSPDGKSLFTSGGNQDVVYRYAWAGGTAMLADSVVLTRDDSVGTGARYPAGLAFITTTGNAHDIALTGSGTIEGQGQDWWDAFAAAATIFRPQEVSLSHVTRLEISGLRFQNSPVEHIWVKQDTNVTITGITISTLAVAEDPPGTRRRRHHHERVSAAITSAGVSSGLASRRLSTLGVGHGYRSTSRRAVSRA